MGRGLRACCFAGRPDATLSFKEAADAVQQQAVEQRASSESCLGDVLGLLPDEAPQKDEAAPAVASKASFCHKCAEERIPAGTYIAAAAAPQLPLPADEQPQPAQQRPEAAAAEHSCHAAKSPQAAGAATSADWEGMQSPSSQGEDDSLKAAVAAALGLIGSGAATSAPAPAPGAASVGASTWQPSWATRSSSAAHLSLELQVAEALGDLQAAAGASPCPPQQAAGAEPSLARSGSGGSATGLSSPWRTSSGSFAAEPEASKRFSCCGSACPVLETIRESISTTQEPSCTSLESAPSCPAGASAERSAAASSEGQVQQEGRLAGCVAEPADVDGQRGGLGGIGKPARSLPSWSSDGAEGADLLAAMHDRAVHQRREAEHRYAQLRQQQEAAELSGCTFSPKLLAGGRSPSRPGSTASLSTAGGGGGSSCFGEAAGSAMYARQQAQRQRQLERLAAQRAEQEREALAPCTFRPAVDARSQRMFASGVRYGGSRLVAGGPSVEEAVHRQLRLLHSAGLNAAAAAAVLASQGLVSADAEQDQPEGDTPATTASQPAQPEAAPAEEEPKGAQHDDLSGATIPSVLQQAAASPTRRQLDAAASNTPGALLGLAAAGRPLSASARLYAHAVNLQERQRQAAALWEHKQRAELLAASPKPKPFPRAQHTHPPSPPLSRRSPPISRPGSAPPPGLLCSSLEQAAAGLAATGFDAERPAAGRALERSTTAKAASYWQRWGLEPGADFDGFLQRQEKFVQALGAKLDAERQHPAALQAEGASPGAHLSPGSRRLLERRRQRELAREMEAAGCMRADMAGCDASSHPSGSSPLRPSGHERPDSGSKPGPAAAPPAPFPFRPAITARAAAKAARTPEELFAEAARRQEKLAQRRWEAEAAALAPCTFAPDIAPAAGSPLSAKYAGKAKGRIDLQDLDGYMREVRQKQAAREEAAAAAAKARQEQELAECTFQPNLAHRQHSPAKRAGAGEAPGPQLCTGGGLTVKAAQPPDVLAQVQALLRGESAAEPAVGGSAAISGTSASTAFAVARQGAGAVGSAPGAGGAAGSGQAGAGGDGFSAFLSQVTAELRKLQAE
ncbi:pathogenesis-related genes transcriptional activator [Chlorella sorokiniana]|uniref:Pathogenesis-related genes transcriptional activator n=1 Tax=Chlorella sorokiniana TaxID=3076 RepID=A0A2P6TJA9_CHLSO|nr:pathogenesis-related genes transcriptional activator [Chlorella sorokiniana]|eukprot:PRW39317.1 pathogenesis-related genes transcriptional activator [Chlorella sorokiniana]